MAAAIMAPGANHHGVHVGRALVGATSLLSTISSVEAVPVSAAAVVAAACREGPIDP
jgi:hypothetical protein